MILGKNSMVLNSWNTHTHTWKKKKKTLASAQQNNCWNNETVGWHKITVQSLNFSLEWSLVWY